MAALALLEQLGTMGVVLTSTPHGALHYKAPKGVLTPVLLADLRQHAAALLALLQGPPGRVPVSCCTRIGPHNLVKQFHPVTRVAEWRCSVCNVLNAGDHA